jgi:hypothetical protein
MTTKRKAAKKLKPQKRRRAVKLTPRAALSVATNQKKSVSQRVKAMAETSFEVCEDDDNFQKLLTVLQDVGESTKVRLAAFQSLQAAAFSVVAFESCRGDYIAALEKVATDPDPELRRRVLGTLAREKNPYAQKLLVEGLQHPEKALVPPEKALQLLGYDLHSDAYPIAREIVRNPPNEAAKLEALRLLAADSSSAPVFEKLLRDKNEQRDIRQISAVALQSMQPKKFQQQAKELLLDNKEYDDIQATALTALTHFGDQAAVSNDEALLKRVDKLGKGKSAKVKKSAKKFLSRYRG